MDAVKETLEKVVNESLKNATNGTALDNIPLEGKLLSSFVLFFMAVIPIYIGSHISLKSYLKGGDDDEYVSTEDAKFFPIMASGALFSLYLLFKFVPKVYIDYATTCAFSISGVISLFRVLKPVIRPCIPKLFSNTLYRIKYSEVPEGSNEEKNESSFEFDTLDLPALSICVAIGAAYAITKHWIPNNFFGIAFAMTALECLKLDKFVNGFILLGGLFFYDIFWVFGTDVMVNVALSFEAPIKVVFPRDFLQHGLFSKKLAMLGLGDIVIPGIFVAMLLRFDHKLNRNGSKAYFYSGFIAYILGLLTTFIVMHVFKHAQPALLYLSPACTGIPALYAFLKGDFKHMLDYADKKPVADENSDSKEVKKQK